MVCNTFISLLFLLIVGAAGKPSTLTFYGAGHQSFYACGSYIVQHLNYSAKSEDYSIFCTNPAAIATLTGCYADTNGISRDDTSFWLDQCETVYFNPISFENITQGYNYYLASGVPLTELGNYTAGELDVPVIVPEKDAHAALLSYRVWLGNYNDSVYYGAGALAYWGIIALVSGAANWSLILFPGLRRSLDGRVSRMWRKYVSLPALIRKNKVTTHTFYKVVSCIVPSRLETIIVFVFFWLMFIFSAVNIHSVKDDTVFDSKRAAMNRYIADRTGILCITLLPLLILFGGRNNFLMWITRWKFATFITFHRWIARIEVLLAFVHGICFWTTFLLAHKLAEESSYTYVRWGIVALFSGVVICFQGLLFLRRRWYETFLVLHILLAAFFVIGAWHHVYELGYSQFMYATFAVWGFDRLFRLGRVVFFGFPRAQVSLFGDDTIKVKVPKPARWKAIPGGHAYVYFMHLYYFWQSHPFTYNDLDTHVTFFCKAKTGVTRNIYKHLSSMSGKSIEMRVGVEGPYGEAHPVKHHSDVVFIAGGNGIPGLYSEFEHLNKSADGKQKLKLKWIIRELKSFAWMFKEFQKYKFSKAEISVFVTRPDLVEGVEELTSFLSDDNSSGDEKVKETVFLTDIFTQLQTEFPHVTFHQGRPEIKDIVEGDIREAGNSVAFIVCGTSLMVDDVRYQVVNNIDKTDKRLDFYEAQEVWA